MSMSGNPDKVATDIVKKKLASFNSMLSEAEGAAEKLLLSAYSDAERRLRNSIEAKATELKERLRSDMAAADLQVKLKEDEIKDRAISEVINEAISRLRSDRGEWYTRYIKSVIEELAEESKEYGGFIIQVNNDDRKLVSDMIKAYPTLELSEKTADITGGLIAISKDGSLRVDYSIDQFIKENFSSLRGLASRALFGSE
ncbi:V-type ATP synthase subunit E [Acidilobus saccharovorans 345-15]|uniref:V-type ATP synthase subunit E n=2 Tax=Acidilobus TaxID=105850 RepID=D9Q0I7_ACIS3|nr:V-type ATP synthase subunit E [Acidilobus saccharovorans 345-15]